MTMKRLPGAFALLFLALVVLPTLVAAQPASLTILHTNDTHGHLLPFSYPTDVAPGSPHTRDGESLDETLGLPDDPGLLTAQGSATAWDGIDTDAL